MLGVPFKETFPETNFSTKHLTTHEPVNLGGLTFYTYLITIHQGDTAE